MPNFLEVENTKKKSKIINLANIEFVLYDKADGIVTVHFISGLELVLKGEDALSFMARVGPPDDGPGFEVERATT
jgi:hypothetical protein